MKQILKYPGAKARMAQWICSNMPKHDVYLEPYAGSLAVLFNKPRSHIETVNDVNDDVVNFFQVLRDFPEELKRIIDLTPYSRKEYDLCYQETADPIERARRFCIRCNMGFGASNVYKNGFRSGQQKNSPNPSKAWNELPESIIQAAKRLKGVQIENLPALELLDRYNTQDVFAYLDPPYMPHTRKGYLYKHEMTVADHKKLLIKILNHPGKIMISGYDNALYNHYLKGWEKKEAAALAESGQRRIETIWMNYEVEYQITMDLQ